MIPFSLGSYSSRGSCKAKVCKPLSPTNDGGSWTGQSTLPGRVMLMPPRLIVSQVFKCPRKRREGMERVMSILKRAIGYILLSQSVPINQRRKSLLVSGSPIDENFEGSKPAHSILMTSPGSTVMEISGDSPGGVIHSIWRRVLPGYVFESNITDEYSSGSHIRGLEAIFRRAGGIIT